MSRRLPATLKVTAPAGAPVPWLPLPQRWGLSALGLGAVLALWLGNPAWALVIGALLALCFSAPPISGADRYCRWLLSTAIVLLGFTLNIGEVWSTASGSFHWIGLFVAATLCAGLLLGRVMGLRRAPALLLAAGTAICGGTAIAALAPLLAARRTEIAAALGCVFALNAVAIFALPALGTALGLSELEFGRWVALAVHDTSSVVATAAAYGDESLQVATTLKLSRMLYLVPVLLLAGLSTGQGKGAARLLPPPFIALFLAASACATLFPQLLPLSVAIGTVARALLVLALLLVGLSLGRTAWRQLDARLLGFAFALWLLVLPCALLLATRVL